MGTTGNVSAGQVARQPVLDSYGRLSRVPETGELEKIETQWDDNRTKVERVGGVLGEELSDGSSAWKRGVRQGERGHLPHGERSHTSKARGNGLKRVRERAH
jgi:site-specific DNA recombinase